MLAIIAVVTILAGAIAFLTGTLPSLVALCGTDRMSELGTATVKGVVPHFVCGIDGQSHAWLSYTVDMEVGEKMEELSVWAPEWYGARQDGTELAVSYNPDRPSECMLSDVRETMEELVPLCSKVSAVFVAAGGVLAVVAVLTGI